jgi:pSer/pThr/pTyr-binding forkhead associated (FHA) protein
LASGSNKLGSSPSQTSQPSTFSTPDKASGKRPASGEIRKFQLLVFDIQAEKNHSLPLKEGINLVGCSSPTEGFYPQIDLLMVDPQRFISRRHAEIIVNRGVLSVKDLGSRNGTEIRGRLIAKDPVEVEVGELIVFARTRCKIVEIRSWT